MILSTTDDNRSFTMGFKGERYTITHSPIEVPDDAGRHIYNLFGQYLIMEPSPVQESQSEPVAKETKTKRKHKTK